MARERLTQKQWDMLKMLAGAGCPVRLDPKNRRTGRLLVTKGWATTAHGIAFTITERGRFMVSK